MSDDEAPAGFEDAVDFVHHGVLVQNMRIGKLAGNVIETFIFEGGMSAIPLNPVDRAISFLSLPEHAARKVEPEQSEILEMLAVGMELLASTAAHVKYVKGGWHSMRSFPKV